VGVRAMGLRAQGRKWILYGLRLLFWPRLWLQRRRLGRLERGEAGRVLVIRPDHLGDFLFATPALLHLRAGLPESNIALAVGPWSAAVAARNPGGSVDTLLQIPFPGFTRQPKGGWWQPYRILWQMARALRAEQRQHGRFAFALNLRYDFWWGALLCLLADVPAIGYATPLNRLFTALPLPYVAGRHEVAQNLTLVEAALHRYACLPLPVTAPDPFFTVTEAERTEVDALLATRGLATGEYTVIHPGAGHSSKQWPPERWAAVTSSLLEQAAGWVVLTGSEAERNLCEDVARNLSAGQRARVLNLAGATSLGQLAAVLERARLVLGVDSGPLHLAAALGRPTLRLFGPSDAAIWGPWPPGSPQHKIVQATSLEQIAVAQVLQLLQAERDVAQPLL